MSKIQITVLAVIIITLLFTLYYPREDQMSLVTISTSAGDIHLELDDVNAPITVQNFLKLAKEIMMLKIH